MTQELIRDAAAPYWEPKPLQPGERVDFAIEWAGWLANRWLSGYAYSAGVKVRPAKSTGYQYTSTAGVTGSSEPKWPTTVGSTVSDGSITWTCAAIDSTSLATSISNSVWAADTPLSVPLVSLTGTNATVQVSVPSDCVDGEYYVRNTLTLANATTKKGTLLVRVRAAGI